MMSEIAHAIVVDTTGAGGTVAIGSAGVTVVVITGGAGAGVVVTAGIVVVGALVVVTATDTLWALWVGWLVAQFAPMMATSSSPTSGAP